MTLPKPDFSNLEGFKRDFYLEHPEVMLLDPEEIEQIKKERQIFYSGTDVPTPITCFSFLLSKCVDPRIMGKIHQMELKSPTPV